MNGWLIYKDGRMERREGMRGYQQHVLEIGSLPAYDYCPHTDPTVLTTQERVFEPKAWWVPFNEPEERACGLCRDNVPVRRHRECPTCGWRYPVDWTHRKCITWHEVA